MPCPAPAWPWPDWIAHRGAGWRAPENTLAALRTAAAAGYRMVEFDVRLSADGIPFLLHDATTDRTGGAPGEADALSWAALSDYDFGSWFGRDYAGEPAPALSAVARCTRALGLCSNIEIKAEPGRERETGSVVARAASRLWHGVDVPPLLSSFSTGVLEAARAAAPELPRALLLEGPLPSDWQARLQDLGCIGLNLHERHASADAIQALRAHGATVVAWVVDSPERAAELLRLGCQAIVTDTLPPPAARP